MRRLAGAMLSSESQGSDVSVTISSIILRRSKTPLYTCTVNLHLTVSEFLPRDAIHSAAYAVVRRPSVRPSRSCVVGLSKRVDIISNFFHRLLDPLSKQFL